MRSCGGIDNWIKLPGNPQEKKNCYKILLFPQAFGNVPYFSWFMTIFNNIFGLQIFWVQTLCWQNHLHSYPLRRALPAMIWFDAIPDPRACRWHACAAFLLHTPTDEAPPTWFDSSQWGALIHMVSWINSFDLHTSKIRASRNRKDTKIYKNWKFTWIRQTEKKKVCFPLAALNLLHFNAY